MTALFFRIKAQYLKTAMEYPLNFWMMAIAGILMRGSVYLAVFILYSSIPQIPGWTESELYLLLSFMYLSEGFATLLFDGVWHIPRLIHQGELDVYLSRPASPLFQVIASEIGLQGVGIMAMGLYTLCASLHALGRLSPAVLILSIVAAFLGSIIRLSVNLISNSLAFWLRGSSLNLAYMVHSIGEFARYPVSIYPLWLRVVLWGLIPYAFISTVPVLILRDGGGAARLALLAAVAFLSLAAGRGVFYAGLKRYESSGG